MSIEPRLTLVMIADVPEGGVAAFQEYESHVLPLLAQHGGRLERRLRSADGLVEVHVVSFGSRSGYASYMADPERASYREQVGVEVSQRIVEVSDVQAMDLGAARP